MIDTSKFRHKPWEHQLRACETLLRKHTFGLFWKPRRGKTKAIIDTACILFERNIIDTLLVVAPAQVKDVWMEKNLGEIKTHDWSGARVSNYDQHHSLFLPFGEPAYVVSSVEFLRQQGPRNNYPFVDDLLEALIGRRVWFVYDEASSLGDWKSHQTRSMLDLRKGECVKRVTILDGTPQGNSHLSFYSKFKILDQNILGCRTFFQFRNRYSETVKVAHKWVEDPVTHERKAVKTHVEVVKERNMDDFARRTAPYCEYLEQDTLDMPEKIAAVLPVALDPKSWEVYCQMRDELVAQLDTGVCAVQQAAVKCVRLAQICSGFLGGVQEFQQMGLGIEGVGDSVIASSVPVTKEIHATPTTMLLRWMKARFTERPDFKCVVWSRFVPEIERLVNFLRDRKNTVDGCLISVMYGDAKANQEFFHPKHPYNGPMVMVAQPQAAKYGKNYSKADTVVFLSQDYDRVTRTQAEMRTEAHEARKSTLMADVVVTGPRGQKTIVHDIIASVRSKEEAEKRTVAEWKRILTEE